MARLDVRRLAAVDMWGGAGTRLRRRIILAEFVLGTVGCLALGGWLLGVAGSVGWVLFGGWLIGLGLNYLPLAVHAGTLSPAGALERELADVDVPGELRHYTAAQFWLAVPLLFVVLDVVQRRRR
ncbi:hypothetical protein [Plantactinospora sp. KBS50]|uniref:hypothetical protein n=1 Tax=Plantactinospora sp. KBS50 TaxID=2024580 RepID=UPI000BAAD01A|nr:hypothetical protein [Plantactinospora sp. KBS50]ASW54210.1 hypothetical protein CIK06_08370 [Plantactinospora sp. KBS50]